MPDKKKKRDKVAKDDSAGEPGTKKKSGNEKLNKTAPLPSADKDHSLAAEVAEEEEA